FTSQNTTGTDTSSSGYTSTYTYPLTINSSYAITNPITSAFSISANLSRGLDLGISGPAVFPSGIQSFNSTTNTTTTPPKTLTYTPPPTYQGTYNPPPQLLPLPPSLPTFSGSLLQTTQSGSATYLSSSPGGTSSSSFGSTGQDFLFSGIELANSGTTTVELYRRHVVAVNGTVSENEEVLFGKTIVVPSLIVVEPEVMSTGGEEGAFSIRALLGRGPGGKSKSKRGNSGR
ncbi:MAG: hypothetical protein M1830_005870, partial [Pleopsidium flavum]